jgi:predicted RNase H-like HicB family nuclease
MPMSQLPNEIRIEYDDDSQGYYIIWQPLTVVGMGGTKQEALEDLKAAAHFGIEEMVNSKLKEIGSDLFARGRKHGVQISTNSRRNPGYRQRP